MALAFERNIDPRPKNFLTRNPRLSAFVVLAGLTLTALVINKRESIDFVLSATTSVKTEMCKIKNFGAAPVPINWPDAAQTICQELGISCQEGQSASAVQKFLAEKGYEISVDGIYGEETQELLERYHLDACMGQAENPSVTVAASNENQQ